MKCTALLLAAVATSAQAFSYLESLDGGSAPAPAKSYAPSKPSTPAAAAGAAKGGSVPDDAKLFGHVAVAPVASAYVAPAAQWGSNPTYLDDSKPYSCYSEYETLEANSKNPYVGNRVSGDAHAY
jgi:hypothetical protein